MDFTIRNLPETVLEDLERVARQNGRSVEEEAVERLASPPWRRSGDVRAELAEIDRVRRSLAVPPLTWEAIEQAIEQDRP